MLTVDEIRPLANVEEFLDFVGEDNTTGLCHNAVTYLAIQIKKNQLSDYNVHLCRGTFAGMDHSWMVIENEEGEFTIVDMTVDQFAPFDVPYIGPVSPGYEIHDSVALCDQDNLPAFIEALG